MAPSKLRTSTEIEQTSNELGLNAMAPLPLGPVGDLQAARSTARALIGESAGLTPSDLVLATLTLTAACLHAAHLAQDDVTLADVQTVLQRLERDPSGGGELTGNPLAFVRYVGDELVSLTPPHAQAMIRKVLAGVDSAQARPAKLTIPSG